MIPIFTVLNKRKNKWFLDLEYETLKNSSEAKYSKNENSKFTKKNHPGSKAFFPKKNYLIWAPMNSIFEISGHAYFCTERDADRLTGKQKVYLKKRLEHRGGTRKRKKSP